MNKEKLLRVADAIEKHEIPGLGFNMADWVSDLCKDLSGQHCQTTACGAGWAVAIELGFSSDELIDESNIRDKAQKILGLDDQQTEELFNDAPFRLNLNQVTPAMAIATYRHAAKHGVIDWDAACAHLLPSRDRVEEGAP